MKVLEGTALQASIRDHFVAITVQYNILDASGAPGERDVIETSSAFVIDLLGVWFLVTAGHVIDRIDGIHKQLNFVVRRVALADFFNLNAVTKKPTPFTYEAHHKIHIDEGGVDIGLIPLHEFYQRSLRANGIQPLPYATWDKSVPICDDYALIGTPEEEVRSVPATNTHAGGVSVLLSLIPVRPRAIPEGHVVSAIPRFAADLLDGGQLKSVKGMSGGPIIGIKKSGDETWKYACLAVQAGWLGQSRIILGTPVGMIVHFILQELESQRRKAQHDGSDPTPA